MLSIYLAQIGDGDERDKFTEIYFAYRDRMFRIIDGILHNHHDSEDALQNAFMYIARHVHELPETDSPLTKGYLFKAAENSAFNMKKRVVDKNLHDDIEDHNELQDALDVLQTVETKDTVGRILELIKSMPEHYSTAVYLHVLHGYSAKQIAEFQGIKYETAKTRLSRAMKLIRKLAKENGYDE